MSEGWKNGYWEAFKCPLCRSTKYVEMRVQRPGGKWYTTPFYKCFHCSVMFHDPQLFSRCSSKEMSDEAIRGPGRIVPKGSAE
jgi:hypothetical protein